MFSLTLNGQRRHIRDVSPNTTLLDWLRERGHVGTKEGCAEGDCGACTVAIREGDTWKAINSCLVPLPAMADREVLSVEGLSEPGKPLHPAQQAMVDTLGSQCGYCTPGFVMSIFEACHRPDLKGPENAWKLDDQLCGNLCRCTGYRPIRQALDQVAGTQPKDGFQGQSPAISALSYQAGEERFFRPATLEELWPILDKHPNATFVCGATDLGLDITQKGVRFSTLVSLEALPIGGLERTATGWRIGATLSLADLERAAPLPILTRMLRYFASRQIKHRATLGGNLCTASPIGDSAPVLMALGASAVLASKAGLRSVLLDDFFLDYRKIDLRPGEILAFIDVPFPKPGTLRGSYKVSKRREMDISAVSAAFVVELDAGIVVSARLAFGGMAATTKRASATEAKLIGKPWNDENLELAIAALDFTPMSDHRGSAWYRTQVAGNLLRGFYAETRDTPVPALQAGHVGTVQVDGLVEDQP